LVKYILLLLYALDKTFNFSGAAFKFVKGFLTLNTYFDYSAVICHESLLKLCSSLYGVKKPPG